MTVRGFSQVFFFFNYIRVLLVFLLPFDLTDSCFSFGSPRAVVRQHIQISPPLLSSRNCLGLKAFVSFVSVVSFVSKYHSNVSASQYISDIGLDELAVFAHPRNSIGCSSREKFSRPQCW